MRKSRHREGPQVAHQETAEQDSNARSAPAAPVPLAPPYPHRDCGWQMAHGKEAGSLRLGQQVTGVQTSEELAGVEDLDHLVTLQLVGPILAQHSVATVEHAALAQPLDQHTLSAAVQQHSTLQVPEQLSRHLPLALAGDGVRWREAHQLQALEPIHFDTRQTWLAQGQAATLRASGGGLAHQLAPVVEADDHLGKGCGKEEDRSGLRGRGLPGPSCANAQSLSFSQTGELNFLCV